MKLATKVSLITLAITSTVYPSTSCAGLGSLGGGANVCTDPTSTAQIVSQTAADVKNWAEEKMMWISKFGFDEALKKWKETKDTMRTMTEVQKLSKTKSETANLAMQSKMEPSPTMCEAITSVVGLAESLDDFYCEMDDETLDFASGLANDRDNDVSQNPRSVLAKKAASLINNATIGKKVDPAKLDISGALPGHAEGGYTQGRLEAQRVKDLLKITFDQGVLPKMPTGKNGKIIGDKSSDEAKAAAQRWLTRYLRNTVGFTTAQAVASMSSPRTVKGQVSASILDQIKSRVDRYNDPEFIKLLGNGGDKSCMRNARAIYSTQEDLEDWLNNNPIGQECRQKFTTSDQVVRLNAEVNTANVQIQQLVLDSLKNIEFNMGIQTQILNEIQGQSGVKAF